MRPRQWTKNLLLFAALLFAGRILDPQALLTACLAFVAFCLASSSVYVVNDVVDAERDRLHPVKQRRPIASGSVARAAALALAVALTAASLALGFGIGSGFGITVVIYLAFSHFYSFVGKNLVIVDIVLIAIGFVLRAVAGAEAIRVPFSNWFILCTFFVALFIAISKRKAELSASAEGAGARPVLALYTREALGTFTGVSMAAAVISYSLYVQDVLARSGAQRRPLLFTVPFVILAIFRYYLLVDRDAAGERPEDVLLTDRPLQLCVLGFVVLALAAFYGG
jgi:4-hydroxybenzoate polyprenyltransferase